MSSGHTLALLALLLAPVSLVLLVALIRGYTVTVLLERRAQRRRRHDEDPED